MGLLWEAPAPLNAGRQGQRRGCRGLQFVLSGTPFKPKRLVMGAPLERPSVRTTVRTKPAVTVEPGVIRRPPLAVGESSSILVGEQD